MQQVQSVRIVASNSAPSRPGQQESMFTVQVYWLEGPWSAARDALASHPMGPVLKDIKPQTQQTFDAGTDQGARYMVDVPDMSPDVTGEAPMLTFDISFYLDKEQTQGPVVSFKVSGSAYTSWQWKYEGPFENPDYPNDPGCPTEHTGCWITPATEKVHFGDRSFFIEVDTPTSGRAFGF
jgi:hypothetical protein